MGASLCFHTINPHTHICMADFKKGMHFHHILKLLRELQLAKETV